MTAFGKRNAPNTSPGRSVQRGQAQQGQAQQGQAQQGQAQRRAGASKRQGRGGHRPPEGQVRQSQLIGSYGPGAMIDLLDHAVVVGGLEDWRHPEPERSAVPAPRLRRRLLESQREGAAPLALATQDCFRLPPAVVDSQREPDTRCGIAVHTFPNWFVCQGCQRLLHARDVPLERGKRRHACEGGRARGKTAEVVPVRFVGACPHGHLQDLPWNAIAHFGLSRCQMAELYLEEGTSGDFSDIRVRCASCGARQRLGLLHTPKLNFPPCDGQRPWLGKAYKEPCDQRLRLLVRTASNGYFPAIVSALTMPEPNDALRDALTGERERLRKRLERGLDRLREYLEDDHADLVHAHGEDDVLAMAQAVAEGKEAPELPLRSAEYQQLTCAPAAQVGERFAEQAEFVHRALSLPPAWAEHLGQLVVVHRLREVRVQVGFTRLEAPAPNHEGEYELSLGVQTAPLAAEADWLPASTTQGEGLFLTLHPERLAEWEARPVVQARAAELERAFIAHQREHSAAVRNGRSEVRPFLGVRLYLLHSMAHLLQSAIALECGYNQSAIRERIYASPPNLPQLQQQGYGGLEMAGLMLYTGSAGSEGTLGGLVEQAERLDRHLRRALTGARLCASDPLCARHRPEDAHLDRRLQGAACHGCLFIAETACERFNRYLDRALVVPTLGAPEGLAYFDLRDLPLL